MSEEFLYYKYLAEKYIQNSCTPEETKELFDYFNKPSSNRILLDKIRAQFQLAMEEAPVIPEETSKRMAAQLMQDISGSQAASARRRRLVRWAAVAAVLLFLTASGYLLMEQQPATPVSFVEKQQDKKSDIQPGGNRARLTLANGTVIVLDSTQNGMLTHQGGSRVLKMNGGKLAYSMTDQGNPQAVVYNTITTPRGGSYQLVLADGSKVWLNAASSLRFPTSFNGRARTVELKGEAYFEIAENKDRPFQVKAEQMRVAVLGTRFNVKAYPDEPFIQATLLQGAVNVMGAKNKLFLKPGQQAQLFKAGGAMHKQWTDTAVAVAWKNGGFSFDNTSIYDIMRQISRWYDVDIRYEDSVQVRLNGHISRTADVAKVFKILALTREVRFEIQGRKIVVSKFGK